MSNTLKVFEHQSVPVRPESQVVISGERVAITPDEYKALIKYHGTVNDQFFEPTYKKIKFKHYVGVLQVGNLVIEILPKVDREENKQKWHNALYSMIRYTQDFRARDGAEAKLFLQKGSLLDLYLFEFLKEVDLICHKGFIKKYRRTTENLSNIKGRIIFHKDVTINHSNKARAICEHQVYDYNHKLHQILAFAINIIKDTTANWNLRKMAKQIGFLLPEQIDMTKLNRATIGQLEFNRSNDYYKKAYDLALLIINNYSPDVRQGNKHIISFLFDMNHLYEQFVYKVLKRGLDNKIYHVHRKGKRFWRTKRIFPDIVVRNRKTDDVVILDTKWKIPKDFLPSDADLKQIFVYNEYYGSEKAKTKGALLYPKTTEHADLLHMDYTNKNHSCSLLGLDILDESGSIATSKLCSFIQTFIEE